MWSKVGMGGEPIGTTNTPGFIKIQVVTKNSLLI